MAKGWVSIHREIQNHWLWKDKPFTKGQAWIDLLMLANHEDTKFILGNQLIEAKRGDIVTSEIKLMERWGWGKTKLRSFLTLLQNDSMIVKKTNRKQTVISIENYSRFQDTQTIKEPQPNHNQTAIKPQSNTINNVNNVNNNSSSEKFSSDSVEFKLSDRLRNGIRKNFPNTRLPNDTDLHKWAVHIDRMIRLDGRKPTDIEKVIDFVLLDNFWQQNILSTEKLRKQFDVLMIKADSSYKARTQKGVEEDLRW